MSADLFAWSAWPAPAKLNLFLRIVGRRTDGYHQLQTVFQLVDWGDTVSIRRRRDDEIHRVGGSDYGVPAVDDLVVRAARLLLLAVKSEHGVDISVEKHIPAGGGFGGGSSDAATVLVVLNRTWGLGLGEDALAELGLQLGADVPVFVRGRNAWAEGVGEKLVPIDLPAAWYLLVDSGVSVPTRELFQAPDLTRDAVPATIADFASGAALGNAFEPVLRRLQPRVDSVLTVLSQHGKACLTGTGGGCFLRFDAREAAETAQAQLPADLRSWVVRSAAESSLHRALREAEERV
ncbi:MAG TPA: 4-(cytidine 5'-diphospho)-2-C-methyl-D-erythritol kinase [Arenimonas sp.]|uniref:4-(cytidine 5'-diphospho)-2-C-methyl-D-erythritol kinase n=1 Tax=Arenimonas sp. TaxID=1872635 RepID=UPI002C813E02|nr:4-(cytidine 5'-diphospho)-2-C-methyl-D-erythritol kinase [Arenimonas sp.]HMB55748.1 4-(cytidine 5'-diphospho)-2-C-methyl-D-erythritol kinase [Arenimonas sp.]